MLVRFGLLALLAGCGGARDGDQDGVPAADDCDDARADVFPGAPEACDAVDADCDGLADDDDPDAPRATFYADLDGDGFGRAAAPRLACGVPDGFVADDQDCDDARADVFPGAAEVCDAVDGDCDGLSDAEDPDVEALAWYLDRDGDGFGGAEVLAACAAPDGYVADGSDCDDADAAAFPGAPDACGGGDADCDGFDDACPVEGERSLDRAHATLVGEGPGDAAGSALLGLDVDADGRGDVLVAAPGADAAYLARGPFAGAHPLREADLRVDGEGAGLTTLAAGDLDGDALPEVIVGAPGGVWIFAAARRGDLALSDADLAIDVPVGALVAGDLDGDGVGDLAIGDPDAAAGDVVGAGSVLVYAAPGGAPGAIAAVGGGAEDAGVGGALARADLDGDGLDDLIVGAAGDDTAADRAGAAYVFSGPLAGAVALGDADAALFGVAAVDRAGSAVAGAGDIDGDGVGDLLVGAPENDAAGDGAGAAYLVRGPVVGGALSAAHCTLLGVAVGDGAGTSLAGVGDVSGDGRADALVGGDRDRVWVLQGPFAGTIALTYAEGALLEAAADDAPGAVGGGFDFDGDGLLDLLVGTPGADAGGSGAGVVSIVRGWSE